MNKPLANPKGSKPPIILATVYTKERRPWLADQTVHLHLRSAWQQATAWRAGHYIILPDHLYVFAIDDGSKLSPNEWIRFWQSRFNRLHCKPSLRWGIENTIRKLTPSESYKHIWNQIRHQPVRDGLVKKAWEWPFQGEVYEIQLGGWVSRALASAPSRFTHPPVPHQRLCRAVVYRHILFPRNNMNLTTSIRNRFTPPAPRRKIRLL